MEIVKDYVPDHFAYAKVIWDIAAVAYLVDSTWVDTALVHSPILTGLLTWSFDTRRHLIRVATYVRRNPIFEDLFAKLANLPRP
jgi:hypothetical protein